MDSLELKIREDWFDSTLGMNTCLDIRESFKGRRGLRVTLGELSSLFPMEGEKRVLQVLSYITGDRVHLLDVAFEDEEGNTLGKGEAATLPRKSVYIVFITTGV